MIGLLGRKFGMTQIFDSNGNNIPVTVIEAGPCVITAIREKEKAGYSAVQIGYGEVRENRMSKPQLGQFKKNNLAPKKYLKEFRTEKVEGLQIGARVLVETFQPGDIVDISGVSIGKGFQGVVKRHHFTGGERSHGSMFGRVPGSIGASSFPSRVVKGMKAAGHMGNAPVTLQNVEVAAIDNENNLILVKGQVPGYDNSLVVIRNSKKSGKKDKVWKMETAQKKSEETQAEVKSQTKEGDSTKEAKKDGQ